MSEAYFAHPGISNSVMARIDRSPLHLITWMKNLPEESRKAAFRIGTALHHRLLDEGKPDRIKIFSGSKTFQSKAGDRFLDENHPDFICLTEDEKVTVDGMEAAIRLDRRIMALIRGSQREIELYWNQPYSKGYQPAKAKIDCLGPKYILDLKTTRDSVDWFKSKAPRLYPIQPAWYVHAGRMYDGVEREFYFVVVETDPPHGVKMFKVRDEYIEKGNKLWKQALETYVNCMETGEWPGYNNDLIEEI